MTSPDPERRATQPAASPHPAGIEISTVVRQGILLQACLGTRGAVEFLKAHDIGSDVISRVLSGRFARAEDRAGASA